MDELAKYLPAKGDFAAGEYWEVRLEVEAANIINVKNGDVEAVTQREVQRGSARVLYDGGWGFSSFNRLADVREHCRRAVEYARSVGGADARVKAAPALEARVESPRERHPADVTLREKMDAVQRYNDTLREHAGVELAEVGYEDTVKARAFLNSEGRLILGDEVVTRGRLSITGSVNGVPETNAAGFRHRAGFESFLSFEKEMPRLFKIFDDLLVAEDARGGQYDCVVDPWLAGVFVHEAFGHTSEADYFYRDPRLQEIMKLGRTLGSAAITIVDDGAYDPLSAGTVPFDDEGIEGRRTVLLDKGVLTGHLHSRTTAALLDEELTGNARALTAAYPPIPRMTNTYVEPGEATLEELLKELGSGLLVVDSRGGTGGEEFTFSARIGYRVENGEIKQAVKNFTLTGNLFTTLKNVAACSNEITVVSTAGGCGKSGQMPLPVGLGGPYVLITNALIGGK